MEDAHLSLLYSHPFITLHTPHFESSFGVCVHIEQWFLIWSSSIPYGSTERFFGVPLYELARFRKKNPNIIRFLFIALFFNEIPTAVLGLERGPTTKIFKNH